MRPKILLTSNPPPAGAFDYGRRPFAVVADGYRAPVGMPACTVAEAEAFRATWGEGTMVMVGLSRIFTPSNRCKMHEIFHRPRPGMGWFSLDDRLFVGEPWRMIWHFTAVGQDYAGMTDSYLAESRFDRAEAEREPCPFRLDEVIRYGTGAIVATDGYRHGRILVEEYQTTDAEKERYDAEKAQAFEHEKTLAAILKRLTAVAKSCLSRRMIPGPSQISNYPTGASIRVVRTDLPVDRFLTDRLQKVVDLTNGIAEGFNGNL
jgi:hypothetical protein